MDKTLVLLWVLWIGQCLTALSVIMLGWSAAPRWLRCVMLSCYLVAIMLGLVAALASYW